MKPIHGHKPIRTIRTQCNFQQNCIKRPFYNRFLYPTRAAKGGGAPVRSARLLRFFGPHASSCSERARSRAHTATAARTYDRNRRVVVVVVIVLGGFVVAAAAASACHTSGMWTCSPTAWQGRRKKEKEREKRARERRDMFRSSTEGDRIGLRGVKPRTSPCCPRVRVPTSGQEVEDG